MGADYPDWGGSYTNTSFYPLFDMAELAVRLGSIVTHDRRGTVVWFHTFEHGLAGVDVLESGSGSAVGLDATVFEHPPFSAKLTTGTSNPSAAGVEKFTLIPPTKNVGFSAMIRPAVDLDSFEIKVTHYNGTTSFALTLKISITGQTVTLIDGLSNSFTLASGIGVDWLSGFFSHLKLVIDVESNVGVRAIFNESEYDISGLATQSAVSANSRQLDCWARVIEAGGVAKVSYCDNLIVTANEPDND